MSKFLKEIVRCNKSVEIDIILQTILTVFMDVLCRINVTQIWNAESTETQIITLSSNKFTSH